MAVGYLNLMRYDVVVAGAGPAGSMTARILAGRGFRVAVLEEHGEAGVPVSCAGLVTGRVVKLAGVDDSTIMNEIKGAYVYSPGGKEIKIGGDRKHAVVIDRKMFDREMADMAAAEGAEYLFRHRFSGARERDGGIVVDVASGGEEISCRYLVGADGAMSTVARRFNFPEPVEYIRAMQTVVPYEMENDSVKVFFGSRTAPGFFAWIIPEGKNKNARIGLGVARGYGLKSYFYKFLEAAGVGVGTGVGKITAGIIPLGMRDPLSNGRVFLVGDAAAQVKATSGGGIYPGLVAAGSLADSLCRVMDGGEDTYGKDYMKKFGRELKRSMMMRKWFLKADDRKIDAVFDYVDGRVVDTINRYGDIDYPTAAARKLMKKHPGLLKFLFLPFRDSQK
ncbi:MAG: NAD(P)/FAD-dependent oxidoreductase [Thermoplasmata archaeon]|nr:NAD(P)/FAD-dependent oxidoreductase [Thermoplasmata archaeon]